MFKMEYETTLDLFLAVTLILFGHTGSQSAPNSPCPNIFQYRQDGSGKWFGLITVPNPYPYITLQTTVSIYITDPVPQDKESKLELVNRNTWQALASGNRSPVQYRLDFPLTSSLPTIKGIIVNEQVICKGIKPRPKVRTTLTFQHEIFNANCTSSSVWCPFNTFQEGQGNFQQDTGTGVQCGKPVVKTNPLIFYGLSTERGQWPWHAAIYLLDSFNTRYICGGSFIGTRSILTAAHCVRINGMPMEPKQFLIHLGRYNLNDRAELQDSQSIEVNDILVHPTFEYSKLQADLAVLILKTSIIVNDFVRPVCLWDHHEISLKNIIGKDGVAVGWGLDENANTAGQLKMVKMPVVDQQTCIWSYPNFFSQFTSNTTFCAGKRDGSGVCNGDSGGGLLFGETQSDGRTIWKLRGIVSNSKPRNNVAKVCDIEHFVIFTDAAQYLDWINAVYV